MYPKRLSSCIERCIYRNNNRSILVPTKTHGGYTNLYIGDCGEYALKDMFNLNNHDWICQLRPHGILFNKAGFQITFDENKVYISLI